MWKSAGGKACEGCALISSHPPPPFKNIRASALCFAFFASNQIPFAPCTCPLSAECASRAAQTCHNEDTVRSCTQSETSVSVKSFAFLFFARGGWGPAYQEPFLSRLFVFHQFRLFLENRPLRMCVRLDHAFGSMSPDQGGLKSREFDKWARERPLSTVPGRPHAALWQSWTRQNRKPRPRLGHLKSGRTTRPGYIKPLQH